MTTNPASADCRMMRSASYFLVDDVFATAEFYRDVLGFNFDEFFGVPPSFVMVQRDDVNIMFRQVRPPRTPVARPNRTIMGETFDAYVYVSNVDQLAAELRAKKADIVEGPVDRIYDMRELLVRDCNGYVIAFGQG
ncbi:VOC family protein [Paraburkholderia nodosa]|uniref:VOC family protein n=1 Tax=Paraburkholderia nodosa TaxID=392320 RepID=UPI0004873D64|nr:VOC family protein [Paraburkholderia nodosa]